MSVGYTVWMLSCFYAHQPNVIKPIPNSIQERLSKNSFNKDIFNIENCEYEDVLKKSGFKVDFKYTKNER